MRAITVYELIFTLVCGVFCVAEQPVSVRKIYLEKKTKNDLESQATGYIYRSDGDNPPIYIKLGTGNLHQFDNELKNAGLYNCEICLIIYMKILHKKPILFY